jgi:hypothetical protein
MDDYNKSSLDKDLENLISKERSNLISIYDTNFQTQEQTFSLIVDSIEHAEFNNFNDNKLIWNIAGFINIISYDLKIIARDLTFAQTEWQKRHYARHACLIIYESIDSLFQLLGKDFRDLTQMRLNIIELEEMLTEIREDLKLFKTNYSKKLYEIRNVAVAHRNNEVLKQVRIIKQINWNDTIQMISQFDNILNKLGSFCTSLINKGLSDLPELKL